ncbi:MAG: NUDIX hydrolase [Chloroflexi bacterium]|nr:NUDIX hydrolase [Chloroflexota bacterium]
MREEKTVTSRRVFRGRAVGLRVDTVEMPDGRRSTREIVEHADCIAVIALDDAGNVLLENQYRKAVGKSLMEIPAGGIDPGEDAAAAVRREMREETGYAPGKIACLGGFYSAPGYSTEYLYLYLATELVPDPLQAEDTGGIEIVRVPLEQIPGLIAAHAICDAKSVAGLLFYLDWRRTNG